uniref:Uncharacterized protein n=1 Tax=Trypanosoma congolense (strain IL3000) TaxID=1068625 RepID=G0US25_TRYCI|nr:conserved hypothetical protein [Trypanosoma congolense IL3000]
MTCVDLLDMTVAYVQYLYIIISISPRAFPGVIVNTLTSIQYAILQLPYAPVTGDSQDRTLMFTLPNWLPRDSRLNFTVVAVLVPMLLSVMGFLIVSPTSISVCLILNSVALFLFVFGLILVSSQLEHEVWGIGWGAQLAMVIVGILLLTIVLGAGIICIFYHQKKYTYEKKIMQMSMERAVEHQDEGTLLQKAVRRVTQNKRAMTALFSFEAKREDYIESRRWKTFFAQNLTGCVALVAAVVILLVRPGEESLAAQPGQYDFVVVGGCLLVAFCSFVWSCLSTFTAGRNIQVILQDAMSATILSGALMAVSLSFGPVLLSVMKLFLCQKMSCGRGKTLLSLHSAVGGGDSFTSSWDLLDDGCFTCNFAAHPQRCPSNLQEALCKGSESLEQLSYDYSVPCEEVRGLHAGSLFLVCISYLVAYPAFLLAATQRATNILMEEYPLEKRLCDEFSEEELYYEKAFKSTNVSASLYVAYRRHFHMSRVYYILQRISLVFVGTLVCNGKNELNEKMGMTIVLGICVVFTLYTVVLMPYARSVETWYGNSHHIALTLLAAVGFVGSQGRKNEIPRALSVLVVVFIFMAPLFALIVGSILTFRKDRERVERLQRRLQRDLDKISGFSPDKDGKSGPEKDEHKLPSGRRPTAIPSDSNFRRCSLLQMAGFPPARGAPGEQDRHAGASENPLSVLNRAHETTKGATRTPENPIKMPPGKNEQNTKCSLSCDAESLVFNDDVHAEAHTQAHTRKHKGDSHVDDYFGDKRSFNPSLYFRHFSDFPPVRAVHDESGEVYDQTSFTRSDMEELLGLLASSHDLESREGLFKIKREEKLLEQIRRWEKLDLALEEKQAAEDEPKGLFSLIKQWLSDTIAKSGATLRYADVLQKRQSDKSAPCAASKPFLLKPTNTLKLSWMAEGNRLPFLSPINEDAWDDRIHDDALLVRLVDYKNKIWAPLLEPYDGEPESAGLGMKKDAPESFRSEEYSAQLLDKMLEALRKDETHATLRHMKRDGSYCSLLKVLTKGELCVLLAQMRLDDLQHGCPRHFSDNPSGGGRRRSHYPHFCLQVPIGEGGEMEDWDILVHRLLENMKDPMEDVCLASPNQLRKAVSFWGGASDRRQARPQESSGKAESSNNTGGDTSSKQSLVTALLDRFRAEEKDCDESENMPRLRRNYVLRQQLVNEYNGEAQRLEALQNAVDYRIALKTRRYMQVFFVTVCLLSTLALAMCFGGMVRAEQRTVLRNAQSSYSTNKQLFDYGDWGNFTENCCCHSMSGLKPVSPNQVVDIERWVCNNGLIKERVRRDYIGSVMYDGYRVRDLCGMDFKSGCFLTTDAMGRVTLRACDGEITSEEKMRW